MVSHAKYYIPIILLSVYNFTAECQNLPSQLSNYNFEIVLYPSNVKDQVFEKIEFSPRTFIDRATLTNYRKWFAGSKGGGDYPSSLSNRNGNIITVVVEPPEKTIKYIPDFPVWFGRERNRFKDKLLIISTKNHFEEMKDKFVDEFDWKLTTAVYFMVVNSNKDIQVLTVSLFTKEFARMDFTTSEFEQSGMTRKGLHRNLHQIRIITLWYATAIGRQCASSPYVLINKRIISICINSYEQYPLLDVLGDHLNFTVVYRGYSNRESRLCGAILPESSYVDAFVYSRTTVIYITYPGEWRFLYCVDKETYLDKPLAIWISIMDWSTWLLLLFSCLLGNALIFRIARQKLTSIGNLFLSAFAILLRQNHNQRKLLLYGILCLVLNILLTEYESYITNEVVAPVDTKRMNNFRELILNDYKILSIIGLSVLSQREGYSALRPFFAQYGMKDKENSSVYIYDSDKTKVTSNYDIFKSCLKNTKLKIFIPVGNDGAVTRYLIQRDLHSLKCFRTKEHTYNVPLSWGFDGCFRHEFLNVVQELNEMGILNLMRRLGHFRPSITRFNEKKKKSEGEVRSLSFDMKIGAIFNVLGYLAIIPVFVFLLELLARFLTQIYQNICEVYTFWLYFRDEYHRKRINNP